MNFKFMSIGTNCADIGFLGDARIRGPVDNFVIKSCKGVEAVLDNTLEKKIYSESFVKETKNGEHSDDLSYILNYEDFKLVHNNPNTLKFKVEFKRRSDNLTNFLKHIKNKKNWLVFNFNSYFVTADHKPTNELLKLIKLLSARKLLDKTVFVQLLRDSIDIKQKGESWLDEKYIKKLKLKNVIGIKDVTNEGSDKQFKEQFNKLQKGKAW